MRINDLIKELQELPDFIKKNATGYFKYATPLWKMYRWEADKYNPKRVLSFEEAGKVIRLCIKEFGKKPGVNYTTVYNTKKKLECRKVSWRVINVTRLGKVDSGLKKLGLEECCLVPPYWRLFIIHIPKDCFVSSFYKSSKVKDWKESNDKMMEIVKKGAKTKEDNKKIQEVNERLDERGRMNQENLVAEGEVQKAKWRLYSTGEYDVTYPPKNGPEMMMAGNIVESLAKEMLDVRDGLSLAIAMDVAQQINSFIVSKLKGEKA